MKDDHAFDQWLQQALKKDTDYLTDEGFTDTVMAAIPAPRQRSWLGYLWALPVAVLTGLLALLLFPGWGWAVGLAAAFASLSVTSILTLGAAMSLLLVLFTTAVVWIER